jgi:hypothetical protein
MIDGQEEMLIHDGSRCKVIKRNGGRVSIKLCNNKTIKSTRHSSTELTKGEKRMQRKTLASVQAKLVRERPRPTRSQFGQDNEYGPHGPVWQHMGPRRSPS